MQLILTSTSPYRAALLEKLQIPFSQLDPRFTETTIEDESAADACRRLALGKVDAAAAQEPPAPFLLVGSDQVASCDGARLGKPGSFDVAFGQLKTCAGRWTRFESAVCLMSSDGHRRVESDVYEIHYRDLTDREITRYLNADQPWDCAGAIRAERLGIALIDDARGRDFNTLLGLPLMLLADMLRDVGVKIL